MTDVTAALEAMLDADVRAAEATGDTTRATVTARRADTNEVVRTQGVTIYRGDGSIDPEWARENPMYCTGRGPTGRLRNFRAMNLGKLHATYRAVMDENNDPQAMDALRDETEARDV